MWFGVLTAVNAKISILRYVTPYSLVVRYQPRVLEAAGSSETYRIKRRNFVLCRKKCVCKFVV